MPLRSLYIASAMLLLVVVVPPPPLPPLPFASGANTLESAAESGIDTDGYLHANGQAEHHAKPDQDGNTDPYTDPHANGYARQNGNTHAHS